MVLVVLLGGGLVNNGCVLLSVRGRVVREGERVGERSGCGEGE